MRMVPNGYVRQRVMYGQGSEMPLKKQGKEICHSMTRKTLMSKLHSWLQAIFYQSCYLFQILFFFPHTLVKRVILGRDHVWKQFFFQSWGIYSQSIRVLLASKPNLWINTEAGGELTQIFSFCRHLKETFPQYNLILSTHRYDSFLLARTIPGVDLALFSPWDTTAVVNRVLRIIDPVLLLAIEIVTAPVLVQQAQRKGYRTVLCSGFMSKNVDRHQILRRSMALRFYDSLDHILVKDRSDVEGFIKYGVPDQKLHVLGDMKYDIEYLTLSEGERESLYRELGLSPKSPLFVAGSIHIGEEKIIIDAYQIIKKQIPIFQLILAPRFPNIIPKSEEYLTKLNIAFIHKTRINQKPDNHGKVIILDTFGELNRIYALATFAFIGSSIVAPRYGGHNVIEPLVHRVLIFHGIHMFKDKEIVEELDGVWPGFKVSTAEDLAEGVRVLLQKPQITQELQNKCQEIAQRNKNNIQNHIRFIAELLKR